MLDQTSQPEDEYALYSSDAGAQINGMDIVLRGVLLDLTSVCLFLDRDRPCFNLDSLAYQDILISVVCRLLHRCPLTDDTLGNRDRTDAYQLGILALMTTLLFQHGRRQRISYALMAQRLRQATENLERQGLVGSTILLWLLFIGGVSVFHAGDRDWILPQIRRCLLALNIDSWEQAQQKIRELPWFSAVHDKPGEALWKAMF